MRLVLALSTVLAGTLPLLAAEGPAPDHLVLECAGAFGKNASLATVEKVFGKDLVSTEQVDGVEGETLTATVIYPEDAEQRIEILWWDEAKKQRPSTIRIVGTGSAWTLKGLSLGSKAADVQAVNGKPFGISGFDWDMGGYVTEWNGGALASAPPACTISMRFSPKEGVEVPAKLAGDGVTIKSSDKGLAAISATVTEISIGYADQ